MFGVSLVARTLRRLPLALVELTKGLLEAIDRVRHLLDGHSMDALCSVLGHDARDDFK